MGRRKIKRKEQENAAVKFPPGIYGECGKCGAFFGKGGLKATRENVDKIRPFAAGDEWDMCEDCSE